MADAIKDMYNHDSLRALALDIQSVYPAFQADAFLDSTMDAAWPDLALKERIIRISETLGKFLPADYPAAIGIIDQVVMNYGTWLDGFVAFFPFFVEIHGQREEHWDVSMAALARYTPYASSELAVRAFIINHEERMMAQMYAWSKHENELVRRLASEGCRPQLPWGQALSRFKKDPSPILPILEQLKADPSMHVRKSVANNLNDISKTHPEIVLGIASAWYGKNAHTDWIVKHSLRTLLKRGNRDALALFGLEDSASIIVDDFALGRASISVGEELVFSFALFTAEATKARLEYGIDYVKSNGKRSRKIFKISEVSLKEGERKTYTRKQAFADLSTRKHYPGTHAVTLIVNGFERATLDFELQP